MSAPITPDSHLYLIDGSGYIFRAYHALPPLTRARDGAPVGAVSGFCNMIFKLLVDMKAGERPTHLAVIFDRSENSFRKEIYPAYKAQRPPPPEDLVPQFQMIRDATRAFGLPAIDMERYEADDLIATYARQAEAAGAKVTIISSDKDLMQLVTSRVELFDPMKQKPLGREAVIEKFGVGPEQVIDVQALMGDSVDNVPGAPGIGQKTAAELIQTFGDLDAVLARAEEVKQPKRRETLIAYADQIRISRQLVTLAVDVPVQHPLDSFGLGEPDAPTLLAFLEDMGFRTLTRRVRDEKARDGALVDAPTAPPAPAAAPTADGFDHAAYACVTELSVLEQWVARGFEAGVVAVDTETDALSSTAAGLVGVSLAVAPGQACHIPLGHVAPGSGDLLTHAAPPAQIPLEAAMAALKPLLEAPGVLKVGQNIKYDMGVLARHGVRVAPFDDTMLISYALGSGRGGHGMDELSSTLLGHRPIAFSEVCGTGKAQISFAQVPLDKATAYAAEDADVTLRLWKLLKPRLRAEGMLTVYETLERPLPAVVADMELAGIRVDPQVLSRLSGDFAQRMAAYEAEAQEIAGKPFNLGSPKQIGDILFGEMNLPGGKRTATGAWSTDAAVLETLSAQGHALPRVLLDWRTLSKLRGTYTEALREAINPATGRVHTSYSLAATTTGRLSSSDPNLQNIPIRTDEGRRIREAFIAEDGHVLISADYSQIELRILAHVADIPALKDAFRAGLDIHAMTASEMFGVPIEGMDPMVRRRAKAINFGIIYGISAFGLANQLSIPQGEAKSYIETYFQRFPGIRDYMEAAKAEARETGAVRTVFGRRCWIPGVKAASQAERAFGERQAINAPIQGAAADVIRRAMARLPAALADAGLKARMLLQVHDELVFEAPDAEADATIALVKGVMERAPLPAVSLSVPLVVDARAARSWAQAH
jgi:DNA polymerase-1